MTGEFTLAARHSRPYNFHNFLNGLKTMKTRQAPPPQSQLIEVEDEFVELWNNMASLWGISPTMARIHGLLYITGESLSMDDIMARLGISRGNVSMNLIKLLEWGLVAASTSAATAASITSRSAMSGRCSRWSPTNANGAKSTPFS